jgi:hypothetical protein
MISHRGGADRKHIADLLRRVTRMNIPSLHVLAGRRRRTVGVAIHEVALGVLFWLLIAFYGVSIAVMMFVRFAYWLVRGGTA